MKGNRYLEAFKEQHNVIGLATAVAASIALLNPLPLLIGAVAEVAYLMFYADSRWYALRLAKKFDAEIEERRQQLKNQVFPQLTPEVQQRFTRLETMRHDIGAQASDEAQMYNEVLRKLDFLLEKFLHFASKEVQFREYLTEVRNGIREESQHPRPQLNAIRGGAAQAHPGSVKQQSKGRPLYTRSGPATPAPDTAPISFDAMDEWAQQMVEDIQKHYDGELGELERRAEAETDSVTKAVLTKRVDVLKRRREFIGKIGRIQLNLHHQLQLVEDTFGLINDEIRARPPEQVLADVEDVVSQTQTMTQLLDEVAPFEHLLAS
jgi:hypothetical protein